MSYRYMCIYYMPGLAAAIVSDSDATPGISWRHSSHLLGQAWLGFQDQVSSVTLISLKIELR